MFNKECDLPKENLIRAKNSSDSKNLGESLERLKSALEKAKSPLIWLGVEVDRFGLEEQARQLIMRLNIPYVT